MEPLKNMFSPDFVSQLGRQIKTVYSDFDAVDFESSVMDDAWDSRELKERMRHITECLHKQLPFSFKDAVEILMTVSDSVKSDTIQFPYIVFPDFVEQYGQDDWDTSMAALEVVTQSSSAEFAIRPFLISDRDKTLSKMMEWAEHSNVHVRRLASEGSRPRLPWGIAIPDFKKNPHYTIPILETLKSDPDLYVRRSVANHLNDISKDHVDVAVDVATRWSGESPQTDWIVKHAMRGLLKKGHVPALRLFGFAEPVGVVVTDLALSTTECQIGDEVELKFEMHHETALNTRLEYAVDYVKKNGSVSRKVFMVSEKALSKGVWRFTKKIDFSDKTTRKHYPGQHDIYILVNGVEKGKVSLHLQGDTK